MKFVIDQVLWKVPMTIFLWQRMREGNKIFEPIENSLKGWENLYKTELINATLRITNPIKRENNINRNIIQHKRS